MSDLHRDVALAIQHREIGQRLQALEARDPEVDLKAEMHELAAIVREICAAMIADVPYPEDRAFRRNLHDRVAALEGRLS
jgi:hypothetical protein